MTYGGPSVDVATGCFLRTSLPFSKSSELTLPFTQGHTVKWKSLCWDSWISTSCCFNTYLLSPYALVCTHIHIDEIRNAHTLTGQTQSPSPHIICLLSINKRSYVSGRPGKHGMCISWVLTLSHKLAIVQIHTNLTSFTPPDCVPLYRANSERGDSWAGCALLLCTSLIIMYQTEAYIISVSFHCMSEFYRGRFVSNHSFMWNRYI